MRGCAIVHVACVRGSYGVRALLSVALLAMSCAVAFADGTPPGDGSPPPVRSSTVHVSLLVAAEVSKPAIRIMRTEAGRIWARHAVGIEWLTPAQTTDTVPDLVALVGPDSRTCLEQTQKQVHTLGCFQRRSDGDGPPVIIVFPRRATQMIVGWTARFGARAPSGWLEWRTGTLLGRVIAHEIGHYLLGPAHRLTGLMRAEFESLDVWADTPDAYSVLEVSPNALR